MKDPNKVTDKWVKRTQAAESEYLEGIEGVVEHPGKKAARKKDKMRANVLKAIDEGKWEEAVQSGTLEDWKSVTKKKGGERFSGGVEAARPKALAFQEEFQKFIAGVKAELDNMPDASPEQRKAKMNRNFELMTKFRRTRRRR